MKLKTLFFQILVFSGLFSLFSILIFEIPPRLKSKSNNVVKAKTCNKEVLRNIEFLYTACPNSYFKINPGQDYPDMKFVESWVDNFGARKLFELWKVEENFQTQNFFLLGIHLFKRKKYLIKKLFMGLLIVISQLKNLLLMELVMVVGIQYNIVKQLK